MRRARHLTTLTLAPREVTHLMIGLKSYQKTLLASMGEEACDEYDDLIMVGHLIERVEEAMEKAQAADGGNDAATA